jgi:hypothetical protein
MSLKDERSELCARVLDRLVEGQEIGRQMGGGAGDGGDPVLAEHLGSCVTCFRTMTELRDAPRVAAALRAETPALPRASDPFWDALAASTTDAVEAALDAGASPKRTAPATREARTRRSLGSRARIVSFAATLAAAAAGFLLVARHPNPSIPGIAPGLVTAPADRAQRPGGASSNDGVTDEEAEVNDLDAGALRRLLDRLRPSAPAALTAPNAAGDSADVLGDDDGRVNDELADLDGDELRRVASSLARGAL